jgi:exportin-5
MIFQELPIRVLKTLLGLSTEKVKTGTAAYKTACSLWAEVIPRVLPHLLNLLR